MAGNAKAAESIVEESNVAARAFAVTSEASRASNRVVSVVFATVFLDLVGFGIVMPLLPLYVERMGSSPQVVGFLFASFSFSQLIATPLLGRLSDRVGRRPVILASLVGNAISMVTFAAATSMAILPLLFASRIVAGLTAGNLSACQAAIADSTDGPARASGMGKIGAGVGLGMVVGPFVGGILSRHWGPQAPPLAAAFFAIADAAFAYFVMPETRRPSDATAPAASRAPDGHHRIAALGDPHVVLVVAVYFCVFLCLTNLQVALALLVKARFGWNEEEVGHIFALVGAIMLVIQGGLVGRLTRTFAEATLVLTGCALLAGGLTGLGISHSPGGVIAAVCLVAAGFGVTNPVLSSLAARYAGDRDRGAVLGVAQSSGGLARTVGPVACGYLFARVGAGAPFLGGAISAVVAMALLSLLRRRA
jgi:MFS family permease